MSPEIPRDAAGRVIRPRPSQLLADVMDKLGPDHLTTRTLMAALIERDRGAGVEPRAGTPVFSWHVPVLSDVPNVPYDMQESSLDIEATLSRVGAFCEATGSWSAGVAGANVVGLSTIAYSIGAPWALSGGQLVAPFTGTYLEIHSAQVTTSPSLTYILIGAGGSYSDWVQGAAMTGRYAAGLRVVTRTAGQLITKHTVDTRTAAGSAGTVRLFAAYLGNPAT